MKKHLVIIALLACPSLAMADNFAECLLDKLPGVQNRQATIAAANVCGERYPERLTGVEWGAGRGFIFSKYDSPTDCFQAKANAVQDGLAIGWIRQSCARLYGQPPKPGLFDDLEPTKSAARAACEQATPGPWCDYR